MAVKALQHFARMRGGAQAQLLLADDRRYYIVKFQNNPQHRRVLANELLAGILLGHLGLPAARGEVVEVSSGLVAVSPGMYVEAGGHQQPCAAGLQFGSCYPGDPARLAVYDYLPESLFRRLLNADCFVGMAAFDKWVSNADGRQAVFFRGTGHPCRPAPGASFEQPGLLALMIDHGFCFTAQQWVFRDLPQIGIYPRPWLYEGVTGYNSFEPWLGRIRDFSLDVLDDAYKRLPPEWYDGDMPALEQLLEQLYARRALVPDLLKASREGARNPFPNWR